MKKLKSSNQNHYVGMKRVILACMILVPVIPFILSLGIGYFYFTTSLETSTIASLNRILEDHRFMIESFLGERKEDLNFLLNTYSLDDLVLHDRLTEVFINLQKKSNTFIDLGVFDEHGLHIAYQGPYQLTGKVYKETDWFQEVTEKGFFMSNVFLGFRRVPHFIIAIAKEEKGEKWIIRATIDTYLFSDLVKKVRIGKTGESYIIDSQGLFQTERRSGGNILEKDTDYVKMPPFHEGIDSYIDEGSNGIKYLYATVWMKNKDWLLIVRQEVSDAFSYLHSAAYLILLISALGGGVIIAIAFYVTDYIINRIRHSETERDGLNKQLIRAGRLAEIGEMSTGFAHEINNPLQIIKSEQSLIDSLIECMSEKGDLKKTEEFKEIKDSFEQIKYQVNRCAETTQAILKFGRKSEEVTSDIYLQSIIPEVIRMLEKRAEVHAVMIYQSIETETPPVHADPSELQQVLLNLLNNAIDAVIEKHGSSGGKIYISATQDGDNNVEIKIQDNGCGINEEDIGKIFSPFFTTKPVGKGTGLGLSVCYGIIKNMGGTMEVVSDIGHGALFKINLKASA